MNELYIFVDSERPDQYLNVLVHCALERDVRTITFLHIKSLTSTDEERQNPGLSGRIMAGVQAQLEGLAERQEYVGRNESGSFERTDLVAVYGKERAMEISGYYRRVRELPLSFLNKEVEYCALRSIMKELSAKKSPLFLDVTAVKKRYLGDIVAAGLVEGIRGLWTFDLLTRDTNFKHPWTMLIHELRDSQAVKFRYTNILNTETYKACIRLVFIRAPKYKRMAIGTIVLMLVGAAGYAVLGENNGFVKLVLAASGIASIASLALVFTPPRNDA